MRAGQSTLTGTCNVRAQVAGRNRYRKPNTVCKSASGSVDGNGVLSRPDVAKASQPVLQPETVDDQVEASNGRTDPASGTGDLLTTADVSAANGVSVSASSSDGPVLKPPAPPKPPSRPRAPAPVVEPEATPSQDGPSEAAIAAALARKTPRAKPPTRRANPAVRSPPAASNQPQQPRTAPMQPHAGPTPSPTSAPTPIPPVTGGPTSASDPPAAAVPPSSPAPQSFNTPVAPTPPQPMAPSPRRPAPPRPAAPIAPATYGRPGHSDESTASATPTEPLGPTRASAPQGGTPQPAVVQPPQDSSATAGPSAALDNGSATVEDSAAGSGPPSAAPPQILAAPKRLAAPVRPSAPTQRRGQQGQPQRDGGGGRGQGSQGDGPRGGAGGGRGAGRGGRGAGRGAPSRGAPGRGRQVINTQRRGGGGRPSGNDGGANRQQDRRGRPSGGQTGKLTAANRRKARQMKKEALAAKRQEGQKEREEIFEVPTVGLSVDVLADRLAVNKAEIVKVLFTKGVMVQVNQQLDVDTVRLAAAALGAEAIVMDEEEVAAASLREEFVTEDDLEYLVTRPPVVCVMGHVDHGKTSLLDRIRAAAVAADEAGGITQAIGAYNVVVESEEASSEICFLDTPGHEAFSAMRARGAKVTDIAVVIVAADDGVRPQTLEAVAHARAAGVPIVVAVNKIDKPGADVNRVLGDMAAQADLVPEEWGGDVPFVSISAKKGDGIPDLLETLALVAEVEELQANPDRVAEGTVLEAHLDKQKGDVVQAGAACGRVRACRGSYGEPVEAAGPSTAVSVEGLDEVPAAGDVFRVFEDEAEARTAAEAEKEAQRTARLAEMSTSTTVTLSTLATVDEDQEALQRMNLIVKADASGSLEAIKGALRALPQDSVALRFLLAATGPITPSDVDLAHSSGALIMGFNVEPTEEAAAIAKQRAIEICTYDVIYGLLDDVRARMEGRLKAVTEKVECGSAEVKATFGRGKGLIAGCVVTQGKMMVKGVVEVRRGRRTLVHEGPLSSLRRFKDEVAVVEEGVECGIGCDGFWEWEEGDRITCFELVEKTLTLEESRADRAVDGDFDDALAEVQAEYAAAMAAESDGNA